MSKILSAVAWPYANGPRHIGHVAAFLPADVFSRYMRMAGHDVLMVSGTDEHGTPILVAADEEGVSARELADRNNRLIVDDLVALGLSYDLFTRTTARNHYAVVQELFRGCLRNGYLVEQTTRGAISPSTGRTLPDRYIEGTCPICGYDGARGDQCDNCGNQLDATDLIDPRSKINGETPDFVETQHYLLDLPALAEALSLWLDEREASGTWRPNVIRFSQNILEEIRPRAMTRDIDWGIPVPGWEDQPTKRLYVWFDAVVGYLSAAIEWARRTGDAGGDPEAWRQWWNDPEALSYYFMGKDNITFHAQIWPAELLAYDGRGDRGGEPGELGTLNLPTEVVSSEFLTMEGKKFSSSKKVVIYVRDVLERYQPDALRYFISAAGPESNDSDFTWAEFVRRTNDELVAGWGNLVNRTATLLHKNFGEIPQAGVLTDDDTALLALVEESFTTVGDLIARHRQRQAIGEAMRTVGEVNRYVSEQEPWKLKGDEQRERLGSVLHVMAQCVQDCNLLLAPFLPHSANAVDRVLGGAGEIAPLPRVDEVDDLDGGPGYPVITGDYRAAPAWGRHPLTVGTPVPKATPVFTKLDPAVVDEELARLGGLMQPGEPSRTAYGAATHRAVHQVLEGGRVFRDPLAWRILGADQEQAVERAQSRPRGLRLFIAVRHRFAEDTVAAAVARGTAQVVVLGAGLDTFGYRCPHPGLRVFEVDHPDTGRWKQQRLAEAGIDPGSVTYVGVDFERDDLLARLADGGLDPARPATFLWLGVVPYLTPEAVRGTLARLGSLTGAEVVLDYPTPSDDLDPDLLAQRQALVERVAALGEPLRSTFEPAEIERVARDAGFDEVEHLGRDEFVPRYFGVAAPASSGSGGGRVLRARRTS